MSIVTNFGKYRGGCNEGGADFQNVGWSRWLLLPAGNAYLSDSLMDSLAMRNPLYSISRESYGGAAEGSVGGSVGEEAGVDISDPGVEPEPSGKAVVGSYTLWRGRMVYSQARDTQLAKRPLKFGNVLAVVSDVKIGVGPTNVLPSLIDYYTADVVEMSDYEPFGMLLSKRHWVSGEGYRFGFQAQEGDDEWSGEGNMLAFKYRVHDARLGRFLSIDPLAAEYPWNSSYAFSENRVIDSRELEGLERLSVHSPTYSRLIMEALAMKATTHEEIAKKQAFCNELSLRMYEEHLRTNAFTIDVQPKFLGSYSIYLAGEGVVFEKAHPREKSLWDRALAWDEQFADPSVGKPFFFGAIAIVLSGGTLLEALPAVMAGTAEAGATTLFVVDCWGMASSVNGMVADKEGNTPASRCLEMTGMEPKTAKVVVLSTDLVLNLVSGGFDGATVFAKPEPIAGLASRGYLSRLCGASKSPNGFVKTIHGLAAATGMGSVGLDGRAIYELECNSGKLESDEVKK